MAFFGRFYLDREKDIVVELFLENGAMRYVLRTPNHHSGNLITNLAGLCRAELKEDEAGLRIMVGPVFSYVDGSNRQVYIMRLGGTKVANIYPDGTIERKAAIPAIAKTLMSQTKDYRPDLYRTLVKTYILSDCKFRTDLHTHMNAILPPDTLIALGIVHQIRYPLYYIKKLGLGCTDEQRALLDARRKKTEGMLDLGGLTGKYRDRKIDDNCFINFADLILGNPKDAASNIARIRASLAVLKDGQAVFSNLEKVYLYRYVFTKGTADEALLPEAFLRERIPYVPDPDIAATARQMLADREDPLYRENTLFQNKLLWIARSYAGCGIRYAEISDTALAKADSAPERLAQIRRVMPAVREETGVMLRFLAGIRRTPLTIVRDSIAPQDYLRENLKVLEAIADDPWIAGCDILGEEINDIGELKPLLHALTELAGRTCGFVIRIHAGESDSLRDNVEKSLRLVQEALAPGRAMPSLRIGHGLYTPNLKSARGKALLRDLKESGVTLEFQLSSNVRLNNLSRVENHPLRSYLRAGVDCVQGTDGGALYGTNSIDEELALERMLGLSPEDLLAMCRAEEKVMEKGLAAFREKTEAEEKQGGRKDAAAFYRARLAEEKTPNLMLPLETGLDASLCLAGQCRPLPEKGIPLILAGGSFNSDRHRTRLRPQALRLIDSLLDRADPEEVFFVIGHRLCAYEKYLLQQNRGRFRIFAIVPARLDRREAAALLRSGAGILISIEPNGLGQYKSFAYEIFKRRPSVLLALDGNAAGANLIQEARNARHKCRIFVSAHSRTLRTKSLSLQGYARLIGEEPEAAPEILAAVEAQKKNG